MPSSCRSLGAKRVFCHRRSRRRSRCRRRSGSPRCCRQGGSELVGALIYEKDKTDLPLRDRPGAARQAGLPLPQRLCARRHRRCCAISTAPASTAGALTQSYARDQQGAGGAAARGHRGRLHDAALGRHRVAGLRARRQAPRHRRARLLRDAGDRLDQPRLPHHRQGEGSERRRRCATTSARSRRAPARRSTPRSTA